MGKKERSDISDQKNRVRNAGRVKENLQGDFLY